MIDIVEIREEIRKENITLDVNEYNDILLKTNCGECVCIGNYDEVFSDKRKKIPPVTANLHPEDYRKLNKSINDLNRTIADINELWGVH